MERIVRSSRFLITGGAGFIGSNIGESLLKAGFKVRVLDNFLTGKQDNIKRFFSCKGFEFVEGDIRDQSICIKACADVDYVLHHAALVSVPQSIEGPLRAHEINDTGTLNVFLAARDQKVKACVYASSSAVYGDDHPLLPKVEGKESALLSPYAASKASNEAYGQVFHELYGLKTVGLRYFNVFGHRQDPASPYAAVIPKFIAQLMADQPPVIFGDGQQTRDFTYIENVVQANLLACSCADVGGQVFNIGCGDAMSVQDLFHTCQQLLGKDIQPVYSAQRQGDIRHSYADISKAREKLGYEPTVSFYQGLQETAQWYQSHLGMMKGTV